MLCPYCKEEMEKGFLQAGNILVWVKKRHYLSLLPRKDEIVLDKNYLTGVFLPSWLCRNCKKVITEYEEQKDYDF